MSRITTLALAANVLLSFFSFAYGQTVDVTIPNQSGDSGQSISIPVNVGDLTGLGVISYQFKVTFDENVLDATGVTSSGTLSETSGWSVIPNTNNDGEITVGGFGFSSLAGSGILIKLDFDIVGDPTETTNLDFFSFVFNGGTPAANTSGGLFTVTGTPINITVQTNIATGTKVYVDGIERDAPYSTQWYANTSHTIGVDTEQSGGTGTKYIYNSWTHGGAQTQTVTPGVATTYTATLDTKYYLTVNSTHDNPQGEDWYDAGTTANFGVTTPADEAGGERYRFTNWSGDYTGTNPSGSVVMDDPKTVTANWQKQYFLTTSENPPEGGDVSPATPGDWYDENTNADVDASAASGYEWAGWSGDLSGNTKPTQVLMNAPKSVAANFDKLYQITIETNPAGREFVADGTTYNSTQVFNWAEGSQHTISVSSPQGGATGVQYVYSSWSDGGAQSHTYTVPGSNQTVTANFTTQYYLTVTSTHDTPQGENWYNSGSTANFSVTSPADELNGTRYVFTQWSGDYSGTDPSGSVLMNQPKEVVAGWNTQHYLTVTSAHDTPQGEAWYNEGANANFSVTTPADESGGTRYAFTNWTGDYSGTSASGSVSMNSAKEVIANWKTQYLLTTIENPSAGGTISPAVPGDWYDDNSNVQVDATVASGYQWAGWSGDLSGTTRPEQLVMNSPKTVTANFGRLMEITVQTNPVGLQFVVDGSTYSSTQVFNWVENSQHTISVSSPQGGATGVQYVYSSWSDGGAQSHTYTVPGSNQTVTANFTTQYYLTVTSTHDTPQGENWYNSGSTANFSVTSPADELNGTRYVFTQWSGDYSGTDPSGSVLMNQPKEVVAGWNTQHYLTVTSAHDTPQGEAWYNEGANANFSVTTPADESGGTRYAFTNWTGDYSGTSASGSVSMNSAKEVIANWKTQYLLTTIENPSAGGTISPAVPGDWYDDNSNVQVDATVASGYQWAGWSGDLSGTTRPDQVLMNSPKSVAANFAKLIQVTIQTNPSGREFVVDGTTYNSTQVFNWLEGSQHTLATTSPQSGVTGVQYTYASWSDGGAQSHAYLVPGSNQTVTANFTTQYYLTVTSAHDTPQGENWYNAGSTANFSVTSPTDELNGTRYVFLQWSGDYSGTSPSGSVLMNQPKEVVAGWNTQHFLTVTSAHDNPQGEAWYNEGAVANFSVTTPADESGGTRYAFTNWTGDYSGTSPAGSVAMTTPKEVIANWKEQYFLSTAENPPQGGDVTPAPPGDWYDKDAMADLSVTLDISYEWDGWSGDLSGDANPTQILMDNPKSVTANFSKIQELISTPNRPDGPSSGIVGQSLSYTTGGSSSSLGHDVEYKFDWGDGSQSDWGAETQIHEYTGKGTFTVKARARCTIHTEIFSDWSNGRNVSISAYELNITVLPEGAGTVDKNPNKNEYGYNENVQIIAIPSHGGSSFDHWSGDLTGNTNPKTINMNGDKNITAHFNVEIISVPNIPSGPNEGVVGEEITFRTSGSSSNFGHDVEYQFDFGDGNVSNWGWTSTVYAFSNIGSYSVRARARCTIHPEAISDWSAGKQIDISGLILTVLVNPDTAGHVDINPNKDEYNLEEIVQLRAVSAHGGFEFEYWSGDIDTNYDNPVNIFMRRDREITANFRTETISIPNIPAGPANGSTEEALNFETGGALSSFGHDVEYQFDWGDGTFSDWGFSVQDHVYDMAGTMLVRARARCVDHTNIVSGWSDSLEVILSDYTITIIVEPAGTGTVELNPEKDKYTENEEVELIANGEPGYSFREWSGDLNGNSNPAQIIMNDHKVITAHFEETTETVSAPTFLTGPDSGIMGQRLAFETGGSVSSIGSEVAYQFDWGDGTYSYWDGSSGTYVFNSIGEKQVRTRARSVENISVVSEWSETKLVTISGHNLTITINPNGSGEVEVNPDIVDYPDSAVVQLTPIAAQGFAFESWSGDLSGNDNPAEVILLADKNITAHFAEIVESVTTPQTPVGLDTGFVGQNLIFSSDGAENTFGYEVEYQFSWGDGTLSSWGEKERAHIYHAANSFFVKARARTIVHPGIISEWSEPHQIQIVGLALNVTIEPVNAGIVAPSPHKTQYAYQDSVILWTAPMRGFAFDHWSGDLTGDFDPGQIVMNSNKNIIAHFVNTQESVSKPDTIIGPNNGFRAQALSFLTRGSESNFGNDVEYQFDWGDGNLSLWGDSTGSHVYILSGNYLIRSRARSLTNPDAVSEWYENFSINIGGCKLYVDLIPENSGDVIKNPNQTDYDYGAAVVISAVNNSTYVFRFWNDDIADSSQTKTVVMAGDTSIVANFESLTNVEDQKIEIPEDFKLSQNYPNPFNPETKIDFQVPEEGHVKIAIYNIRGQLIRTIVDEIKPAGFHTIVWNGLGQNGSKIQSGIYLYRFETRSFHQVRKMILLK